MTYGWTILGAIVQPTKNILRFGNFITLPTADYQLVLNAWKQQQTCDPKYLFKCVCSSVNQFGIITMGI